MEGTFPTFIYAGAPKAGSSSIYELLRQHPDIFMSPTKEPFFFDFNYDKGLKWYAKHFAGWSGESAVGEATVWYMRWPGVPERIYNQFPEMKFLFVLRDPAERLWSNYWHDFQSGYFDLNTQFSDEIRDESDPRGMRMAGNYHAKLEKYEALFGRERLLVLLIEDLADDETFAEIYRFLNVDPSFRPDDRPRKMITAGLKHPARLRAVHRVGQFLQRWTTWDPVAMAWHRSRHFRELFLSSSVRPPGMSSDDKRYLRDLYRADTTALSRWLDRDLSKWLAL